MNVLLYSSAPALRRGGVAGWSRQLVTTLSGMGHTVHVLTWGRTPPHAASWGPNLHFQPLNPRLLRVPVVGFWTTLWQAAGAGRKVIEEAGTEVIQTTGVYEAYGASLARGSGRAALVLSIHGDFAVEQGEWWKSRWRRRLYLPLERRAFDACQVVSTSSAWLQERLEGRQRGRTAVIPNGIALEGGEAVAASRTALGLPEDGKIVLSLNSLYAPYRQRGLKLLIQAAPAILARVPGALFLVAGGVTEPERDAKLVAWAQEQARGLPFTFTGYRQRSPRDLMEAADLYVHPSFLDNSPTAVLEAMALGKPVVATDVGGIPELIADGETGLLVPPEPEALAQAVVRLLEDKPYAEALGRQAREVAQRSFRWNRVGEQFVELYEEAIRLRHA